MKFQFDNSVVIFYDFNHIFVIMAKSKISKIYKIKSPAKINIGLRVLSKRADGFHNIETIFYPIKIYDNATLKITKTNTANNAINFKSNLKGVKATDNICYKAVEMFLNEFKINEYKIDITLKKNVPVGAGLGGGSSDAASILLTLAKHYRLTKELKKLNSIALQLGSDVPFFLLGKPAYAGGRGEKLTPLPKFKIKGKILIVNPNIHISTPWAYKELKVKSVKSKVLNKVSVFKSEDERLMINDFERVVFKKYPKVEKIKYDMLKLGAEFSLMSGSGSTVYGVFSGTKIKAAEKYFRGLNYKTFIG